MRSALSAPQHQFVVVDIGARDDVEAVWRPIADMCDFVAFEPDEAECRRLNELARDGRKKFYPCTIGRCREPRTFYVTEWPASSGLYRTTEEFFLGRFPYSTTRAVRQFDVTTVSLDEFLASTSFDHVDFIKVDVEGAELDVLEGACQSLKDRKILGIKTEYIWDPVVRQQRPFSEIDGFLRANGFRLYDVELKRFARDTLPYGELQGIAVGPIVFVTGTKSSGQVLAGNALYFRDPVGERRESRRTIDWDDKTLLRLCVLLDVFGYSDCAIEIAQELRDVVGAAVDVDALIDSLVPLVAGRPVPYGVYRAASNKLRLRQNAQGYGISTWEPRGTSPGGQTTQAPHRSCTVVDLVSPRAYLRSMLSRLRIRTRELLRAGG